MAYCLDGSPYPYQETYGVLPYFADILELKPNRVIVLDSQKLKVSGVLES